MERHLKKYVKLGDYNIQPYDMRFYALYKAEALIGVFVYKIGALSVMALLYGLEATKE